MYEERKSPGASVLVSVALPPSSQFQVLRRSRLDMLASLPLPPTWARLLSLAECLLVQNLPSVFRTDCAGGCAATLAICSTLPPDLCAGALARILGILTA